MEALANLMVATAELVEAEGRSLRRHLLRLSISAALVMVAALVALFGIGFLLYGLFWLMAEQMSGPATAAIFGMVAVGLAGGIAWIARQMIR